MVIKYTQKTTIIKKYTYKKKKNKKKVSVEMKTKKGKMLKVKLNDAP